MDLSSDTTLAVVFAVIGLMALGCQWLAWALRVPAILLLLAGGIVLGPVSGALNPDDLFGDLLFPLVSLCVALILFEGSLTLKFDEIRGLDKVVRRLVTTGAALTWLIISVTAHTLLKFSLEMSLIFGALVVVTGPTVIVPLLRTVRPTEKIANVLRWEGIVIDPLGALLAVVVYQLVVATSPAGAFYNGLLTFLGVVAVGVGFGLGFGYALGRLLRDNWLPGYLHNLAAIALALSCFTFSNALAHESGLLAVTIMGVLIANMDDVHSEEILSFNEHLSLFFISGLFVLLAARLDPAAIMTMGLASVGVLLIIQFVARPAAVWVSALGSDLTWREKMMIAWVGPRGIVAAAVSALFALRLEREGFENASLLVAATFVVIIGTVVFQSLTSRIVAGLLGVREPSRNGFLLIGANPVARAIATALQKLEVRVVLCDSNWEQVRAARMEGLETFYGNALSDYADSHLDLTGIGFMLALHPHRETNVLTVLRYRPDFGPHRIFQLRSVREKSVRPTQGIAPQHKGMTLGGEGLDYGRFAGLLHGGAKMFATQLSDSFGYEDCLNEKQNKAYPLFAVDPQQRTHVFSASETPEPESGWTLIGLDYSAIADEESDGS